MPKQPLKVDNCDPFLEILLRQDANGRIIFSTKELIRILHKEISVMGLTLSNTADAVEKKLAIIFLTKMIEMDVDLFSVMSTIPHNIIEELASIVEDNSSNDSKGNDSKRKSLKELSEKKESLDWVLANISFVNLVLWALIELSACMSESSIKKTFFEKLLQKSESLDICKKHETFNELKQSLEERTLIIDMSE